MILAFVAGLSILLYPTVSNYYNSLTQSRAVINYNRQVNALSDQDYQAYLDQANAYNSALAGNANRFTPTAAQTKAYDSILDVGGNEVIGILNIPKISVNLPIYHGTTASVLEAGVGHVEGSSLPVGGPGTHAVISGHTGLPSAELLTDLDKLKIGDQFTVTVLGERLTYQVDQTKVVLPDDMSDLGIVPGQDYVTLVTCTPYGVNDHRLLVRGHRVANGAQPLNVRVNTDALQINSSPLRVIGVGLLFVIFLIYILIRYKRKNDGMARRYEA